MASPAEKLAREIAELRRRLEGLERAASADLRSIDGRTQTVYDENGVERARIGRQEDGSYTYVDLNAPAPPAPTAPIVTPRAGMLDVEWDGGLADGSPLPLDFARVEVHVGTTTGFLPTDENQIQTFTSRKGGRVSIALDPGTYFVVLQTANTSGKESVPSTEVSASPKAAASGSGGVQTFASDTAPVGLDASDEGAIWFDTDAGNAQSRWSGTQWVPLVFGSGAIGSGAVGAANLADAAVESVKLATGAVGADASQVSPFGGGVIGNAIPDGHFLSEAWRQKRITNPDTTPGWTWEDVENLLPSDPASWTWDASVTDVRIAPGSFAGSLRMEIDVTNAAPNAILVATANMPMAAQIQHSVLFTSDTFTGTDPNSDASLHAVVDHYDAAGAAAGAADEFPIEVTRNIAIGGTGTTQGRVSLKNASTANVSGTYVVNDAYFWLSNEGGAVLPQKVARFTAPDTNEGVLTVVEGLKDFPRRLWVDLTARVLVAGTAYTPGVRIVGHYPDAGTGFVLDNEDVGDTTTRWHSDGWAVNIPDGIESIDVYVYVKPTSPGDVVEICEVSLMSQGYLSGDTWTHATFSPSYLSVVQEATAGNFAQFEVDTTGTYNSEPLVKGATGHTEMLYLNDGVIHHGSFRGDGTTGAQLNLAYSDANGGTYQDQRDHAQLVAGTAYLDIWNNEKNGNLSEVQARSSKGTIRLWDVDSTQAQARITAKQIVLEGTGGTIWLGQHKEPVIVDGELRLGQPARLTGQDWHYVGTSGEPAFENGWYNSGGNDALVAFYKDASGMIHIQGVAKGGSLGFVALFTLPVGFRPAGDLNLLAMGGGNPVRAKVYASTGAVTLSGSGTATTWYDLSPLTPWRAA